MMKEPENFAAQNPIDTENCVMDRTYDFHIAPCTPSYNRVQPYLTYGYPFIIPIEYTGWRDELLAAQYTCALTANLNPSPSVRISGPEAADFLKYATVNNIDKFPVNSSKHGIIVDENGDMAANGVLLRSGEDTYEAHWLSPLINFLYQQKKFDCTLEDITMSRFIFQLIGPKSLEIVEEACEEDFHDLKLCKFKESTMCGKKVRILRFGMSGGLAYEVHGDAQDSMLIHKKLVEVGNKYGIRLMGIKSYMMNHTPGGSVQFSIHYEQAMPKAIVDALMDKSADKTPGAQYDNAQFVYNGSTGTDSEIRRRNPFELGLGKVVNFDHDFIGKEALLKVRDNQTSTGVTLKWNVEDIIDVYESQFRDEVPYQPFENPSSNMNTVNHKIELSIDRVFDKNGKEIGISGGRTFSPYHQAMLSLASIELPYAQLGEEVFVLWGDPGQRQKKIRASVVPTPYNTNYSNRTFDVNTIPRWSEKAER